MKQNRWTIKYRSLTYIYLVRSMYVSHWSITLYTSMMFIHQIILKIFSKITRPWNIGHVDLYLLWGQSLGHTVSLSENITLMHQIVLEIWQSHWTMKYRSHRPTFILRSNVRSYWPLIPKNDVHTSNSLQDHSVLSICTVRYRKLNGACDARSEWTDCRVSLSAAFGEFSLFNTLLIYNDSVKLNLSFKDLCHFVNVSLLAIFFFFISSLNHWPWQEYIGHLVC